VRTFTVVFGALQIMVGIGGRRLDESVVNSVLSIAGFTTGIRVGVFGLGMFTRRVGQAAALCGLCGGLAVISTVVFFPYDSPPRVLAWLADRGVPMGWVQPVAWPWYTLIGSTATFAIGVIASLVFPRRTDPR
jgi:dolichol kinase